MITVSSLQDVLQPATSDIKTQSRLEPSAILILLREQHQSLELILTRRSYHLKNHPGQICFAGGRLEGTDKNLIETAVREAHEEIGLPPETVKILGVFDGIETISGFLMSPVVAITSYQGKWKTEPEEVHSILSIPLNWAMKENRWRSEYGFFLGKKHHYLTAWWQGQLIWGATAKILNNLSMLLQKK